MSTRMRYLPFVQHLAAIDEGSADWNAISLTFRALALSDARTTASDTAAAISGLLTDARAVRDGDSIIEHVCEIATRLGRPHGDRRSTALSTPMVALAVTLRRRCLYDLARDTAQAALRQASVHSDDEWRAHRECGWAEWSLGNLEQSGVHFSACIEIGQRLGTMDAVFSGRLGHCHVVKERGNLPRAETLYQRLAEWGRSIGRPDFEAHARHGLGITIGLRGRLREGLEHLESALPAAPETERSRILTNIAYMRLQLGEHEHASDTFLEVTRSASDRYEAHVAHVNLIEVYAAAGRPNEVEVQRRYLEEQRLPPSLAVDFYLTLGRAYVTMGDPVSAAPCFYRAAALAQRVRLGRDIIEADREIGRLIDGADHASDRSTRVPTFERDSDVTRAAGFVGRSQQ